MRAKKPTIKPTIKPSARLPAAGSLAVPAHPVLYALLKPGLLLAGLLAAGLLIRSLPGLHHGLLDRGLLRDGLHGRVIFLCAGFLICAVGLPRQAVGFAGGFAYGPVAGTVLATIANLLACLMDMLWARLLGRGWVRRKLLPGRRMTRLGGFVAGSPFMSILTLRLLPVGSSLMVSLLAGILDVRIMPFLAATLIGSLPQTVIFVLIGSGARIGHAERIVIGVALFVVSGVGGTYLLRRKSAAEAQD